MGKAQEKRDAAEKAAAKKAEKDAKKAALKKAREAKKLAREEKKKDVVGDTKEDPEADASDDDGEPPEASNAAGWSDEEQHRLDAALRGHQKIEDVKAKWKAIAAAVGGERSAKACAARFKEVRSNVLARREWEERRASKLAAKENERAAIAETAKAAYDAALDEARRLQAEAAAQAAALGADETDVGGGVSRADDAEQAADALAASGVAATFAAPPAKKHRNAKDINVTALSVSFHGSTIVENTDFVLNWGNRYGLIGKNGSGKSTLIRVIGARAIPVPESIDIFHLTKEYPASEDTALEAVMKVDDERAKIEREIDTLNDLLTATAGDGQTLNDGEDDANAAALSADEADDATDRLNALYERLDELDAATAETRACSILTGLGFSTARIATKTKDFSGGWRMRVALARALFIQPDLLLLDEPTNHLDMEAVVWLEDYLSRWSKMLFMVCHSQDFLNSVCSHVVHLDHHSKRLVYYKGNYDQFVETRRDAMTEQLKRYQAEQDDIKAMKEYVARFGHGTAKLARQGKSREKLLNKKLSSGLTEKPVEDERLKFKFPDPGTLPPPVLQVNSLTFGYPGCPDLYTDVDFGLDLDSRVALVGPNGAGKSTLVKIINGELVPRAGQVRPHAHLRMSKFTQHFEDILDYATTPLDWFMKQYPEVTREDARKWLGRYGTTGAVQQQVIKHLSEGQKAKVVFCKMAKEGAHMLLLDEPTNALDMEMIDSLADAINDYKGGVVLVSHDMRLISQVAKEIWIVDKGVRKYRGDIRDFKMDLRKQMKLDDGPSSVPQPAKGAAPASRKTVPAVTKAPTTVSAPAPTVLRPPAPPVERGAPLVPPPGPRVVPAQQISSVAGDDTPARPLPAGGAPAAGRYIPPALRRRMEAQAAGSADYEQGDGAW